MSLFPKARQGQHLLSLQPGQKGPLWTRNSGRWPQVETLVPAAPCLPQCPWAPWWSKRQHI